MKPFDRQYKRPIRRIGRYRLADLEAGQGFRTRITGAFGFIIEKNPHSGVRVSLTPKGSTDPIPDRILHADVFVDATDE